MPHDMKFTDAKGRTWDCKLTLAAAKRIDASDFSGITDTDVGSILRPNKEFFINVLSDYPLLFAMVWAVVYPQAKKVQDRDGNGFSPLPDDDPEGSQNEFMDGIDGKTIEAARDAFWEAIMDFFPQRRTALSGLMKTFNRGQEMIGEKITGMEGRIQDLLAEKMDQELDQLMSELEKENGMHGGTSTE